MTEGWRETSRTISDGDENPLTIHCRCGREIKLWWNGGELDGRDCSCGVRHVLEHGDIFYVTYERSDE